MRGAEGASRADSGYASKPGDGSRGGGRQSRASKHSSGQDEKEGGGFFQRRPKRGRVVDAGWINDAPRDNAVCGTPSGACDF